ncbi:hypothetical protein M231_03080 [Tremella mesenterica]|uniref:Amidohydrolase 3 domain-containing protein n=1 Tax=Tremella mesenterica TaxID=5217 RepID=A0A4Q1BNY2_TREME|nr:hypothetical protein M231_03080 [Tremella mesenterica]
MAKPSDSGWHRELKATGVESTAHGSLAPKYKRHPPPLRRPTRGLNVSISLLILAVIVLLTQRKNNGAHFSVGGSKLPQEYVICTRGKNVYTVPEVGGVGATECLVIRDKEVVDTGGIARIRRKYENDAREDQTILSKSLPIYHLPMGYTITPGWTDAHCHPLMYGYYEQLPLRGSKTIQEVVNRVEEFVKTSGIPDSGWVEGMGWDQNLWPGGAFPTAADLNVSPLLRNVPISLARIDVHAEWVSQAVLDLMGPLPDHVEGGQIIRDAQGSPTGIFLDNAIDLVNTVKPKWSDTQRTTYLQRVTRDALSKGLTGLHDAQAFKDDVEFYRKMGEQGKLGLRFNLMVTCPEAASCGVDDFHMVDNAADGRLNIKAVKLFADGALGSGGAALLEDYSDQPGWKGFLLKPEEQWKPLIKRWYDHGWQVNVHAIGDRANKVVIDAMEYAIDLNTSSGKERRLRIEHAQIMRPEDLRRAVGLGIIGSYQPTHATSDMWYAEKRLGKERLKGAYAWKTYLNLGGRIALGSDFPVESIDPLKGFYAAVTRLSEEGDSPHGKGGWYPEERLSREETLRGMTIDAAYASFSNLTGSLTPGKRFDAVIWDDDLMSVDVDEMLGVRVKATIIDGEVVFGQLNLEKV